MFRIKFPFWFPVHASLYSILRIRDRQPGNTQSRLWSLVMGTLVSVESEYGRHLETAFAKSTDSSLPLRGKRKHCGKLLSLLFFWVCCCISFYLRLLPVAMIQHFDQKQPGKGSARLAYPSISRPIIEGSQGRNSKRNLKQKIMEEGCFLLAGSFIGCLVLN